MWLVLFRFVENFLFREEINKLKPGPQDVEKIFSNIMDIYELTYTLSGSLEDVIEMAQDQMPYIGSCFEGKRLNDNFFPRHNPETCFRTRRGGRIRRLHKIRPRRHGANLPRDPQQPPLASRRPKHSHDSRPGHASRFEVLPAGAPHGPHLALFLLFGLHKASSGSLALVRRQGDPDSSGGVVEAVAGGLGQVRPHAGIPEERGSSAASAGEATGRADQDPRVGEDRGELGFEGLGAML